MLLPTHGTSQTDLHGVAPHRTHSHLEKILASSLFTNTRRLKSLLRYLVLRALERTSGSLNEYRIALEAFDRSESFDPSTDPIVRVEMGRLRARLKRYYDEYAVVDGITFEIPRGTYDLSIRDARAGGTTPAVSREAFRITIGVSPLQAAHRARLADTLATQLTNELIEILGNEPYLAVVPRTRCVPLHLHRRFGSGSDDWPDIDFVLEGSIRTWRPLVYATMRLIDVKRGAAHVLGHYVYEIQKTFRLRMDLSSAIMADIRSHLLASRHGPRPSLAAPGPEGCLDRPHGRSGPTIDAIVEAAITTFADRGYCGATVEAIALRANVTGRLVLESFRNKNTLFIESLRATAKRTLDLPRFERLLALGEIGKGTLRGTLLAAVRSWYKALSIERARHFIYSALKESAEYRSLIHEAVAPIMAHMATGSARTTAAPRARPLDARAAAESLVAFLIYLRVAPWSPETEDEHAEVAVAIAMHWITCVLDGRGEA